MSSSSLSSSSSPLGDIPSVDIDPSGRFKYILIKLRQNGHEKFVVRGHTWAEYHGIGFLGQANKKREKHTNTFLLKTFIDA